jgi:hypothetical protein
MRPVSARIIVGAVAALAAVVLALLEVGVAAVIAGMLAGGLLLPASAFGGEGSEGFIDASGGGGGGS